MKTNTLSKARIDAINEELARATWDDVTRVDTYMPMSVLVTMPVQTARKAA